MCNYLTISKKIYYFLVFLLISQFSPINYVLADYNNKDRNYEVKFIKGKLLKKENFFLAGIKVNLKPNWKIYWRNPGEAGLPPELDWKNTNNTNNIELLFPNQKLLNFLVSILFVTKMN